MQERFDDNAVQIEEDPMLGEKCPVYKCTTVVAKESDLEDHFKEAHADLISLGLSVSKDDNGKVVGNVKDTLLSQMMVFMLTNKTQCKRFMIDYEEEEAELLRTEISKLASQNKA